VPFVFHDDDFDRLTDTTGRSDSLPVAEVQRLVLRGSAAGEVPQTFAEFLAQIAGRVQLQIELKPQPTKLATGRLAAAVVGALRGYRGAYVLQSFDPHLVIALRKAGAGVPLGIITYGYDVPEWDVSLSGWQRFVLRNLLHWPLSRFDYISCRDVSLSEPAVRLCRALGMTVSSWTINSPEAAAKALRHADQIVFEGFLPASA
jgi:glycerophosphoryl diester phosphodiesterase